MARHAKADATLGATWPLWQAREVKSRYRNWKWKWEMEMEMEIIISYHIMIMRDGRETSVIWYGMVWYASCIIMGASIDNRFQGRAAGMRNSIHYLSHVSPHHVLHLITANLGHKEKEKGEEKKRKRKRDISHR